MSVSLLLLILSIQLTLAISQFAGEMSCQLRLHTRLLNALMTSCLQVRLRLAIPTAN